VRDPGRIDQVLEAIRQVWVTDPDLRLGQLLINAVRPRDPCPELYSVEDTVLVRKVANLIERRRIEGRAAQPDE
jgi:hypothetical protein